MAHGRREKVEETLMIAPPENRGPALMEDGIYLTEEGRAKIEAELRRLVNLQRTEIADRIRASKQIRDFGDDSDFEDAKMAQAFIESRIAELQSLLKRAQLVTWEEIPTRYVGVGSVVRVRNTTTRKEETITIVGAAEADPAQGRISNQSPVGRALLGAKVNDVVEVQAPAGAIRYRIKSIRRPPRKRPPQASPASDDNGGPKKSIRPSSKSSSVSARKATTPRKTKTKTKTETKTKTKTKTKRKTASSGARASRSAAKKSKAPAKKKTKTAGKAKRATKSSSRATPTKSASKTKRKAKR